MNCGWDVLWVKVTDFWFYCVVIRGAVSAACLCLTPCSPACWNSESRWGEGAGVLLPSVSPGFHVASHHPQTCSWLGLYPDGPLCRGESSSCRERAEPEDFWGLTPPSRRVRSSPLFFHLPAALTLQPRFAFGAILESCMNSSWLGFQLSWLSQIIYHVFIHFPDSCVVLTAQVGCPLFS